MRYRNKLAGRSYRERIKTVPGKEFNAPLLLGYLACLKFATVVYHGNSVCGGKPHPVWFPFYHASHVTKGSKYIV